MSIGKGSLPLTYRPDIDGLRAIAVCSVVLYHAFPTLLPSGFIGVDIFFVISGYLISRIIFQELDHGNFALKRFYAHRIRRIFPALAVVLALCLGVGRCLLSPSELSQLGRDVVRTGFFITNFTFAREINYFDGLELEKPLLHMWSLSIEEQFYVVWPGFLMIAQRVVLPRVMLVTGFFFASLVFWAFYLENPVDAFFLPQARFWELAAGTLVASFPNINLRSLSAVGTIILAVSLWHINQANVQTSYWLVLPVLATAFMLMGKAGLCNHMLSIKPLVCIGKISYPLYLVHWPALCFLPFIFENPTIFHSAGTVLISALIAWMIYAFVEKPVRKKANAYKVATLSFMALICVVAIGNAVTKTRFFSLADKMRINYSKEVKFGESLEKHRCLEDIQGQFTSRHCALAKYRPNVIIVGDSHALAAYYALRGAYPFIRFILFESSACTLSLQSKDPSCQRMSLSAYQYIKHNPLDAVIVVVNWASKNATRASWHKSQAWLLDVNKIQQNLILFRIWPTHPNVVFSTTAYSPAMHPSAYSAKTPSTGMAAFYNDIKQFAAKSGMEIYDSTPLFCKQAGCIISINQNPLYRDKSHLSVAGTRYLQKGLENNFKTLDDVVQPYRAFDATVQ